MASKDVTELPDNWVEVVDVVIANMKGGYRKS